MIECMSELDEISLEALNEEELEESEELNNLLIEAALVIDVDSEEYRSRNEEIARIAEHRTECILRKVVYSLFGITVGLITMLIIDKKVRAISERRDYLIFSVLIAILATLGLMGILEFLSLTPEEQIENLRFTSGSLIQGYVAALAIVPGIILAMLSFFASRYPPRITKKIWKSRETALFFLSIAFGLAICCFVLISLNEQELTLKMGLEIFSVGIVLSTIFLLADRIKEIFDMRKVLSNIKKDIQEGKDLRESFHDLISVFYSLAENRDSENLEMAVTSFFDLIDRDNGKYFKKMKRVFLDILEKYKEKREYFLFERVREMIEDACTKEVAAPGNRISIEKCEEITKEIDSLFENQTRKTNTQYSHR
jgi:hypothetical protein